ncbi:hypothetical protein CROQUDRAFT_314906 [Cronartium quercuum f. sp. fusiforme G11]|uniref:Uncharacterized protein n=1 Tax=Cronartium quercuum f. sp. fusiforme G11 TaxID=708437 RepID=A0A9P6NXY0_9BASI|nr:hypothetical protein CROQUDRAFT_314906 [Cronartium quercuum f. sp. fusiforme G11]
MMIWRLMKIWTTQMSEDHVRFMFIALKSCRHFYDSAVSTQTTERLLDALVQRDDEFSDSEDEGEGGRTNNQSQRRPRKVPRTVLDTNRSRLASGSLIQQNFAPGPNGTSHAARGTRRPLPAAANIVSNGTNGVASADVSIDSNTFALDQSLVVAESNPRGGPLVRDEADRMELETMAADLVEEVNQAVSNSTPATSAVPQQVESAIEERIGMTQTGQPDTNVPQSDEGHKMQIDPPLEVTQEHIPMPILSDGPSAIAPDQSELTKPAPSVEQHDLRPTAEAISVVSEVEMSDFQSLTSAPSSQPIDNASDRSPQRFSNPHMSLSDVNELRQILDATDTDVVLNTTDPSLQAVNARVMMPTEPANAPLNVGSHNPSERAVSSIGLSGTTQPPQRIPPPSHEAQIPATSLINPQSSTASNKLVEQPEPHCNPTLVDAEQSAARHCNLLTDPHSAKPNLHPLSNDHHQSTRVEQPIVAAVIPGHKILDHLPNARTASPSINTSQDPLTPQSIAPAILSDHLPPPSPTQASQEASNRHLVSSNRQITSKTPSSDTAGPTQLSPNWNSSINPSLVPVPPTCPSAGVVPATTITEVSAKAVASQASSQVDMSKGDSRSPWRAMSVEEEMNRMIEQQQRTQMGSSTNDSRNLPSVPTTSGTHPQTNSTGTNATKTESIHPKSSVHHVEPMLTQTSAGPSVIEMDPQLKPMSGSASINPSITTNPVMSPTPLHVNVPVPMPGTSGDALDAQRGINVAAENTELCTPTIHSGSIDPAIKGSLPTHRGQPH